MSDRRECDFGFGWKILVIIALINSCNITSGKKSEKKIKSLEKKVEQLESKKEVVELDKKMKKDFDSGFK